MPRYEVRLSRYISALQVATVFVKADDEEAAREHAWDADLDWTEVKIFDTDQHEAEAELVED